MADNEFLRQKREREFQQRMLAAVEKPKHSRILAALNSRFFSLVVIGLIATGVSSYLTHYQQCVSDADKDGERYSRLGAELSLRYRFLRAVTADAKDAPEIRDGLSRMKGFHAEFRDRRLDELLEERLNIVRKIDFGRTTKMLEDRKKKFNANRNALLADGIDVDSIDYAFSGIIVKPFANQTLEQIRRYTTLALDDSPEDFWNTFRFVEPNCSLVTIIEGTFGISRKTLAVIYEEYIMYLNDGAPSSLVIGPPYSGHAVPVFVPTQ